MPSPLGRLIAQERLRRGMSLRGLAREVGKSPAFLVMLEKNDPAPSVAEETLVRVADVLELPADRLITLAGKTPSDVAPADELEVALFRAVKGLSEKERVQLLARLRKQ
ncbi:MAG TPA: helix-turn-helix transcriptional regulator [Longimicrobiales bacterium]|nr:helix-turn-helix transcriptional regulator [Longimicrobiales bacterium]